VLTDQQLTLSLLKPRLPALSAAVEVAAYRIVLEALANVIRHAEAKHCSVCLSLPDPTCLAIEVVDDGQGLSEAEQPGIGISTMRERAVELGGSFLIGASTTNGTRIAVTLPLSKIWQKD
jgi:signal transduction histidine kinase